jgi:hypothetical protein
MFILCQLDLERFNNIWHHRYKCPYVLGCCLILVQVYHCQSILQIDTLIWIPFGVPEHESMRSALFVYA